MAGNDPFHGIKLSEQSTTPGVEQRLFAAPPKNVPLEPRKPAENASREYDLRVSTSLGRNDRSSFI